ncbi:beta-1,6-N-acetylglucosaminyltransferase [Donghicola tyrosinivorans]|uniref:Peptide O-xylosyltransferase n=1 Tax=Donghicola tyrosinivorans TaxID=1652492 RepID=A0A2T0WY73_9RHOB|nr:beta-1,6-N-acetylglucosaminyltransferase [Donghicola tyrosinivorans]PRY91648.1 core-2/I-Branching enzyme [Donghicola tyrosinivorans]
MTLGVIMLVHTALQRAEQVARHWATHGVPVVIHADSTVSRARFEAFRNQLSDLDNIRFSKRHRCEWGTWGLVAASQSASEVMLKEFPGVRHVYLASGSCLPLRPVSELIEYLAARPATDFIESATLADVPWTVGGLDDERFTLRFPFAWKKHRRLFDGYVELQRRLKLQREMPDGLVPHMGSQWWCLTRQTLSAILQDPRRRVYDRFFKQVWIPDESYFQTLVRLYSRRIESRSLTLSKFDFQGKPHIFYDDHLQLLRRSDCFVARKIWPYADRLYNAFLNAPGDNLKRTEPNPGKIDRIFAKAVERRTQGRRGLYMQSRFPNQDWEKGFTGAEYSVFEGFSELFEDFEPWLARVTGTRVHGHLFAQERAEFEGGVDVLNGALTDCAALRDRNQRSFLTNLLWNTRGERQCFQMGPADTFRDIEWDIAKDPNAQVSVITGAWAVRLFRSNQDFAMIRQQAADLQRREAKHLDVLRSQYAKARIRIWTMAEFVENPMEPLQEIISEIGPTDYRRLTEAPKMVNLTGFAQFLQNLKNQGMHPYLTGDFPNTLEDLEKPRKPRKPYLIK